MRRQPSTDLPSGVIDSASTTGAAVLPSCGGAESILSLLRCPACRGKLFYSRGYLSCRNSSCEKAFPIVKGVPVLIHEENSVFSCADFVSQRNTTFNLSRNRLKEAADRLLPKLGANLRAARNLQVFSDLLVNQAPLPEVLVIGGGILGQGMQVLANSPRVKLMETDVSFGPRTRVICDAHALPFPDASFDGVVIQAVLQYLAAPATCLREIRRVLKPGGLVYCEVAFMQQVVHGRYDFTRFTHVGLRRLFRDYEEIISGPVGGPGMALAWSAQFFLLSFSSARWFRSAVHIVSRLTLFWLKYFDLFILDKPGSYDAASGFFLMCRKIERTFTDRELVAQYRGAQ